MLTATFMQRGQSRAAVMVVQRAGSSRTTLVGSALRVATEANAFPPLIDRRASSKAGFDEGNLGLLGRVLGKKIRVMRRSRGAKEVA